MGTAFSERGDSGSAVVRLVRREDDEVSKDSTVVRSEVVGIVYGIVRERAGGPFVTTFMPISDIINRIKERLDLDISLERVADRPEESWGYEVFGKGKSRYDFKWVNCLPLRFLIDPYSITIHFEFTNKLINRVVSLLEGYIFKLPPILLAASRRSASVTVFIFSFSLTT
jgi:hypothetical protein